MVLAAGNGRGAGMERMGRTIATLAIATALMAAMIAYEAWRFAELRDRLRHQAAPAS